MDSHIKSLLQSASAEIKYLRKDNEVKAARLKMFDDVMLLFTSQPNFPREGGMEPDLVYQIDTVLRNDENPKPTATTSNN